MVIAFSRKPPEPATEPTVADLAELCLKNHVAARCRPTTVKYYRTSIERHILPALGWLPVEAVGRQQVDELYRGLNDSPVAANRMVKTLAHMYRLGEG